MYDKANIIREYKESGDINNMLASIYKLIFSKLSDNINNDKINVLPTGDK